RAKALTHVVSGLVSAGHVDQAFEVVERIDDPRWRARALVRVAGALAQVGDNERARQVSENAADVAEQIDAPDWRAEILVRVAGILAQTGDIGRARQIAENVERLAEQVQRGVQHVAFLKGVVAVLVRRGLIGGVRIVPEIVTTVVEQVHDDFSRGYILDRLVAGLVSVGHVDQAFEVVERIDDPGWHARALVRVAGALAQVGDNERARQVSENAADVAEQIDAPSWRAEVVGHVTGALAQAGDIQRARQIFETANLDDRRIELYHRSRSLVCIVDALAQMGEKERARKVVENIANEVERMKASVWRTQDQERVVDAYLRVGCFEKALGVAERIDDSWARCKALTNIVGWLSCMNRVTDALNVANRIAGSLWYVKALVKVTSVLAGAGDTGRAKSVAEDAVSAAEQIEDPEEHATAQKEALAAQVWFDVDSVLEIARKEPKAGDRARILANVSEVLVRAGDSDRAKSVAEDAVNSAELIKENEVRARILANVSEVLVRAGDSVRAKSVAEDAANVVRSVYGSLTHVSVVEALIGVGAIEEALNIVSMIRYPSFRICAHSAVMNYYVRHNSSGEAINVLDSALAEAERFSVRMSAQEYCSVLASVCLDAADHVDASSPMRERWLGLARSVLARSWLYGVSVWDSFDVLVRVAPELAVQLVDERILAEPEGGTPPESDPDLGPEGPGGHTGAYR
ncbi:tetratricopeptide repeat protein, partial [Actinomyces acetigenes]